MSSALPRKYKYFQCTVQIAEDRRQKFQFCRLKVDATSCLRWYGTLNMDQKVCLNMVKKEQLCAIALKKRN